MNFVKVLIPHKGGTKLSTPLWGVRCLIVHQLRGRQFAPNCQVVVH